MTSQKPNPIPLVPRDETIKLPPMRRTDKGTVLVPRIYNNIQRLNVLGEKKPVYQNTGPTIEFDEVPYEKLTPREQAILAKTNENVFDALTMQREANEALTRLRSKDRIKMPEIPNKMAQADPRWGNKVAFSSEELAERQEELATHSAEVEVLFDTVRKIAERVLNRSVKYEELSFVANFGSPITDNRQYISILLAQPIELRIQIIRELVDRRLKWTVDATATVNTPQMVDLTKVNQPREPEVTEEVEFKELPSVKEKRRKVKL